ncbi:MAG TPA: polysaccharide biosynthesis tyrosine autokinase [Chryseolinea sp.]|nr:polysaccharide biosynthesis tyrosine autokinase [Chryseolinea sp.]
MTVENQRNIRVQSNAPEGIDFNKLKIVARSNWFWLLAIFLIVNVGAYLGVRYTKNLYKSSSVLKLDVKKEASEFGIKTTIVEDQNLSLISGEIEIIQSRLFLNRVVDSSALDVSYYSIGHLLNDELYQSHPFTVKYKVHTNNLFDRQINFLEEGKDDFTLRFGFNNTDVKGKYDQWIALDDMDILIAKNEKFRKGDEIGYFFIINSENSLLEYLLSNLSAEPLNYNANTIQISFQDNNPFKANAILNKIDTVYLQYSNEQKNLATKQKIEWISNELVNIERKMEDFEHYFENFTLQNKTNNMDEDLKKTVESINRIDSQRYGLNQRLQETDKLLKAMETGNYNISLSQRSILPAMLATSLERLEQLLVDQEKLKLSYNEITFAFREKNKEIDLIREKALRELTELRENYQQKLELFNQSKSQLEYQFANLPDKSTQLSKNLRYYKLYEQFYLSLVQSKSEFEITQAGSIPDFKILSPAAMPHGPISPDKPMIAGVGFVSSIVLMLFLLGILYLLNDKITTLSEIERVSDVPVLGVVPSSKYLGEMRLHIIDHPRSMVTEAIRTLRTNLDFFNIHATKKVITISSTVSGEGKSFIAMNLGGVMALSNKKVILLDLDMRKPKTLVPGNVEDKSKGISTILIRKTRWEECIAKTSLENFHYIPSGPHPPNPSELLMNPEFESLLNDLKKDYDYIILDTPPVGLVTDGIMAMKRSDITIYIFRANYSKKDFLFNLQRIININKFSNITTLLNALPNRGDQGYGYGYYEDPGNGSWFKKILKG